MHSDPKPNFNFFFHIFFSSDKCTAAAIRADIRKNLAIPHVLDELRCLAIIGKAITGPWMTAFYTKSVQNLEMRPAIQESVQRLEGWHSHPEQLADLTEDVLGRPIPVDPTLNLTLSEGSHETVLKPLVGAIISVFKRQFKRFLEGDLVDPTPEDIEKAQHACSHNMAAERILGLTDSMCRKAPNATGDFLSGKLRYRLNGTAEWLDSHQDQELLFNFVVKESYKAEAQSRQSTKALHAELQARRVAVAQGREDAMRKTVGATLQQLIQNPPAELTVLEAFVFHQLWRRRSLKSYMIMISCRAN